MTGQFLRPLEPRVQPALQEPMVARGVKKVTLYTDSYVVRGTVRTRQRRLTDALTVPGEPFLVVEEALFEEFGSRALVERAPFAQINLSTVLFAFDAEEVEATPELRTVKVAQTALISLPPFRIVGHIHLLPERSLSEALGELTGRFVPVTEAAFWSEKLGEPRTPIQMLAFNHARAQILAPYEERDVWAGSPGAQGTAEDRGDVTGSLLGDTSGGGGAPGGAQDPWAGSSGGAGWPADRAPSDDPWRDAPGDRAPSDDPWRDAPGGQTPSGDPWRDAPGGQAPSGDPWRDEPGRKPGA